LESDLSPLLTAPGTFLSLVYLVDAVAGSTARLGQYTSPIDRSQQRCNGSWPLVASLPPKLRRIWEITERHGPPLLERCFFLTWESQDVRGSSARSQLPCTVPGTCRSRFPWPLQPTIRPLPLPGRREDFGRHRSTYPFGVLPCFALSFQAFVTTLVTPII
jgi:hypothetical protein